MWRAFLESAIPFLIPFALYAVWVRTSRGKNGGAGTAAEATAGDPAPGFSRVHPWLWLSIAGLVLAFGVLVVNSRTERMAAGDRYVPAVLQDGAIVPPHANRR